MSAKIDFQLKKYLQEIFFGDFDSRRRGFTGHEVEEIRPFQEGDPSEAVNHRLSVRRGRPMVKVTRPPSGLTAHMICDVSRSMRHKREVMASIVGVLADHLSEINAHFACTLVTTKTELDIQAGLGEDHLREVLRSLWGYRPRERKTSYFAIADSLHRIQHPPRLVFVMTDLYIPENDIIALRESVGQQDTIFCIIRGPRDFSVRPLRFGAIHFVDEETGERIVGHSLDVPDPERVLGRMDCDWVGISTDDNRDAIIERFVALFEARRQEARA